MTQDQAVAALCRSPLFAVLPPEWLAKWVGRAEVQKVAIGDMLFQPNTPGAWAFLVIDGRFRTYRTDETTGKDVSLGIYHPGDTLGEYALVPPHQNTVGCRAAAAGRVLRMPLDPLRFALHRVPNLGRIKNWLRLSAALAHQNGRTTLDFLSPQSYLGLVDYFTNVLVPAGGSVQAPGLADDSWFVIESGGCERAGEQLGVGRGFGAPGLVGGAVPLVTATATTRLRRLQAADFRGYRSDAKRPPGDSHSVQTFAAEPPPGGHKWIGQRTPDECGAASLAMVATALGKPTGLEDVRAVLAIGEDGASMVDLRNAAAAIGLTATGVRVDGNTLSLVRWPAIVRFREGHYVAVFDAGWSGVSVGDPLTGIVKMRSVAFLERFGGEALVFAAPSSVPPPAAGTTISTPALN